MVSARSAQSALAGRPQEIKLDKTRSFGQRFVWRVKFGIHYQYQVTHDSQYDSWGVGRVTVGRTADSIVDGALKERIINFVKEHAASQQ